LAAVRGNHKVVIAYKPGDKNIPATWRAIFILAQMLLGTKITTIFKKITFLTYEFIDVRIIVINTFGPG